MSMLENVFKQTSERSDNLRTDALVSKCSFSLLFLLLTLCLLFYGLYYSMTNNYVTSKD